jgi:hypothetical protein
MSLLRLFRIVPDLLQPADLVGQTFTARLNGRDGRYLIRDLVPETPAGGEPLALVEAVGSHNATSRSFGHALFEDPLWLDAALRDRIDRAEQACEDRLRLLETRNAEAEDRARASEAERQARAIREGRRPWALDRLRQLNGRLAPERVEAPEWLDLIRALDVLQDDLSGEGEASRGFLAHQAERVALYAPRVPLSERQTAWLADIARRLARRLDKAAETSPA